MNKAVIAIAVIILMAVVGVCILNTSPKERDDSLGQKAQIFNEERVFEDPPETVLTELSMEDAVHGYLEKHVAVSSFGDKVFCSYEVVGHNVDNKDLNVYLWVLCSELYVSGEKIKEGAGISAPVFIVCGESENGYSVIRHAVPADGVGYAKSVADMFPLEYVKKMIPEQLNTEEFNERVEKLSSWNRKQARSFYGLE